MSFKPLDLNDGPITESIRVKGIFVALDLLVVSGKDGDYYVAVAPSANISGYGKTEAEAMKSFEDNADQFCFDLFALSHADREKVLYGLGFRKEKFHNKNFSKAFVDENGVLQNFEPGTMKTNRVTLQSAV